MKYLRNKTVWYIIGALIVGLVAGGLIGGMHDRDRGERYGERWGNHWSDEDTSSGTVASSTSATTTTTVDTSLAQPGEHCGGNMTTAKSCTTGYHCAPQAGSHLPFGDVGGICVKN